MALDDTTLLVSIFGGVVWGGLSLPRCVSGVYLVMGTIHSPWVVHFLPQTISLPRYVMLHPMSLNSTLQPASQSFMTDRSECDAKPGMRNPCRPCVGRWAMSRLHKCVDVARSPFGI